VVSRFVFGPLRRVWEFLRYLEEDVLERAFFSGFGAALKLGRRSFGDELAIRDDTDDISVFFDDRQDV